jgi:hypothetical protein
MIRYQGNNMTKFVLFIVLLGFAQQAQPERDSLLEAQAVMHCIRAGDRDWLIAPASSATRLRVGLIHDRKAYEGKDHIVVVVFESNTNGQVFDLRAEYENKQYVYTVVNNGSFTLKNGRLEFLDPPLGGVWTQEYLEKNIKKIAKGAKIWLSLSTLLKPLSGVTCSSYVQK